MNEVILDRPTMIKLNAAVKESVDSLTRSEAEASFRKDVAARVKEEMGVAPALFNAIVKERYNDQITEKIAKLEEVVDMNESIIAASKGVVDNSPDSD